MREGRGRDPPAPAPARARVARPIGGAHEDGGPLDASREADGKKSREKKRRQRHCSAPHWPGLAALPASVAGPAALAGQSGGPLRCLLNGPLAGWPQTQRDRNLAEAVKSHCGRYPPVPLCFELACIWTFAPVSVASSRRLLPVPLAPAPTHQPRVCPFVSPQPPPTDRHAGWTREERTSLSHLPHHCLSFNQKKE